MKISEHSLLSSSITENDESVEEMNVWNCRSGGKTLYQGSEFWIVFVSQGLGSLIRNFCPHLIPCSPPPPQPSDIALIAALI